MKKRWLVVLGSALVVILATMPVMAGISGPGVSGIQIQNLHPSEAANIQVELWNQDGSLPITLSAPSGVPADSATNIYLPNYDSAEVPDGAYAMRVSSNKEIAAIARTDWATTGGAGIYSSVEPATDVIIPLIVADFANQFSEFTVQNTDPENITTIEVTLYGRGLGELASLEQDIQAGTSRTWRVADLPVSLPDTGLDLGASGFVGSIRITSDTPVVAESFIDIPGTPGVTAFSGVSTDSAATELYAPLIRANYFGDTGISIVNPNDTAVDVTITFRADAGSPNVGTYTENLTIAANSSEAPFQGPGGSSRAAGLPGGSQTSANPTPTNDGFYGVATIEATAPVLAVVNDTLFGAGWAVQSQSTYNCAPVEEAGTKFALPLVRRFHLADTRLTTGIQVQNTTANAATVSITFTNWDGTAQSITHPDLTVPAYGSGNFWQGDLTGLPTVPPAAGGFGWYGSAVIESTEPIVVVVSDEGFGPTAVDSANYNGIKTE